MRTIALLRTRFKLKALMKKFRPVKPLLPNVSKPNQRNTNVKPQKYSVLKLLILNQVYAWRHPILGNLQALNISLKWASAGLGIALFTPAYAQTPQNIEEVIISATRIAQKSDSVLAQTTVITREQITSAASLTLAELLQRYAGVEVRMSGAAGQPSGVFIRGANTAHTLILVDGVRVGSASSGTTAIEHLALDLIERIEIVKGSFSGLYGSDAIGGVVQIFTRGQKTPRLNAEINIGNQSTHGFNGGFSTVEGNTYLAFNVGARKTNAASATNARASLFIYNADKDAYSNTNFVLKLAHTLWQGETVAAQIWESRGKAQFDAGPVAAENQQTLRGAQFESSNQILPWWQSKIVAASTRDSINISSEYPSTFATKQNQLQWQNTMRTPVGTLLLGAEQNKQSLDSNISYDARERTTRSVFASLSEQQDAQYLQANVRLDKFSPKFSTASTAKSNQVTGQFAYGVKIWPEELVYSTVARGYKLPSFNDLYYPGFSNAALKPERNTNTEIGYKFERKGTRYTEAMTVNAALFDNKIEDLISFNASTSQPENINRAHIRGLELSANSRWQGFDVRAAITVQQPLDADTKQQLRGRAKLFGSAGMSKKIGQFSAGLDVIAVGKRYDSANEAPDSRLGGYATLSARLQYNISKQFSAELVGSNLTNQPYEQTTGYNTPRRQVMFNLKFSAQ